jgi:hypothetical protein
VSGCGVSYTQEAPALGHDLVSHEAKAATCTQAGWSAYESCSRCDYTTYKEIPATGVHTWGNGVVTTAPTVSAAGVMTYTCAVCGQVKTESIDKLSILLGDVNEDKVVDLKDVTLLFQYVNGQRSSINEAAANVNGDDTVDLKDVTRLFQFVNGQIDTL